MKIFIDMDGVLCDWIEKFEQIFPNIPYDDFKKFDKDVQALYMCNMCSSGFNHYQYIKPLKDTVFFLTQFIKANPKHQYYILTSVGKHNPNHIVRQKIIWLAKFFPIIDIESQFRYVHESHDKALYASDDAIMIDDYGLVLDVFTKAGGIGINGQKTSNIISQLEKYSIK